MDSHTAKPTELSPHEVDAYFLSLRLGIAWKIFDRVRTHLSARESHGKKTIQHQALVLDLAGALSAFSTAELQMTEPDELSTETLAVLSSQVAKASGEIARLMGGHAYLTEPQGTDELLFLARALEDICEVKS